MIVDIVKRRDLSVCSGDAVPKAAFQLLYDYFRRGRRSSLNVVVRTPYVEQFTNIFLGYSAIVKD